MSQEVKSQRELFSYLSFHDSRITEFRIWNPDDLDCNCQRPAWIPRTIIMAIIIVK